MQKPPPDRDDPPPEKNPAAAALGRLGGLKGGAVRASRMSPEERAEAAKKAASARWAKVAEERQAEEGLDDEEHRRLAKPFVFTLNPDEALEITEARGSGGHQSLHRRLVAELAKGDLSITLNDRQFGELVRYMTRYKSGGFQGRLHRAFDRSIRKMFGFD